MCHLNLGYLMDVQERHITNRKYRDSGVHGLIDRSIGWVCSLTSEVLSSLNKGMPPPTYFDWKNWLRAGLAFFRGDMTLRCSALILPHGSRYEVWGGGRIQLRSMRKYFEHNLSHVYLEQGESRPAPSSSV
ncbi:hypothetical protein J6590_099815 [Homalodisca vitripennis]|nr:hypothetical protein J6590_099815 [Homalodisca vitripennis]